MTKQINQHPHTLPYLTLKLTQNRKGMILKLHLIDIHEVWGGALLSSDTIKTHAEKRLDYVSIYH